MEAAPVPGDEKRRLEALEQFDILDTAPEAAFDDLARLAAVVCRTPTALVTLVNHDRQWFKAVIGLNVRETPRDIAFCAHSILQRDVMVVPDATRDVRFHDNPLVTGPPGIRFYASAPVVTADGDAIGTISVIDYVPRELSPEQRETLQILSRQVMAQLELRRHAKAEIEAAGRRAELARHESDERFRALVEHSADPFALATPAGQVLYVSPASERVMGYPVEALETPVFAHVHPDDVEAAMATYAESVQKPGEVVAMEIRARHRDGSWRYLEIHLTNHLDHPLLRAIVANYRDVTERRMMEDALRHSEARKNAILDASPDGIVTIDHQGLILEFNPAAERMFHLSRGDAVGHRMAELLLPPRMRDLQHQGMKRYLATGQSRVLNVRQEMPALRSDGQEFPIEITVVRAGSTDPPVFTGFLRDVTEQKAAAKRSQRQVLELQQWHEVTLNREDRILELKQEVNDLLTEAGRPARYLQGSLRPKPDS
jgi:diguanylate cyclase